MAFADGATGFQVLLGNNNVPRDLRMELTNSSDAKCVVRHEAMKLSSS